MYYSVHNRPHGYSVTTHACYRPVGTHPTGMLSFFSVLITWGRDKFGKKTGSEVWSEYHVKCEFFLLAVADKWLMKGNYPLWFYVCIFCAPVLIMHLKKHQAGVEGKRKGTIKSSKSDSLELCVWENFQGSFTPVSSSLHWRNPIQCYEVSCSFFLSTKIYCSLI